jgi:mono/diheme cytochrome c family protein
MKKIKIVVLAISGLFLVSCESSTIQDVSVVVTNPTYVANVKEVIDINCIGCHSGGGQFPDLVTYSEVKGAARLLCSLEASCGSGISQMPKGGKPLPDATITMINTWATNNFPEK